MTQKKYCPTPSTFNNQLNIKTLSDILLRLPSYILHPFWMPTIAIYSFLKICFPQLTTLFYAWATIGTFILTALIPLLISMLYIQNTGDTLEMKERRTRIAPYFYTTACYVFWCYFLYNGLKMPNFVLAPAIGATIAILLLTLITLKWKLSAHMTCFGAITGAALSIYHSLSFQLTLSSPIIYILFITAIYLCCSRIYLKAHTDEQLAAGFLIGILCTYLPALMI